MIGDRVVRARKVHRCDYCGEDIGPGRLYRRWGWADSGTVCSAKAHRICAAVANAYYDFYATYDDERRVGWEPISEAPNVFTGPELRAMMALFPDCDSWAMWQRWVESEGEADP